MNLGDQLAELRFNILRDRSDIIAGDTDSLWSDDTLLRYIEDAERRFARRTLILRDATTPEVTQVTLQSGVITYPLHKSVLAVISGRYVLDTFDLQRSGHALVLQGKPPEFMAFEPTTDPTISPGKPLAYYTDETLIYARQGRVTFSVYPAPSATETGNVVNLRVIRLPMSCYDKDHLECGSELPADYHLDVLEWAAYRAQRGFDADAGAPTSAEQHKKAFEDAITQAVRETQKKMFANTVFRYGANGFGWVR